MPRFRVLKGVAHNFGHSFTSLMNYVGDDYVMGHILRLARLSGKETLTIDLLTGQAGPPELLAKPVSEIPSRYVPFFWDLVQRHGSDRAYVQSAMLSLRYDLAVQRVTKRGSAFIESPYTCEVRITDTRGKHYLAHFEGWWYPERLHPSDLKAHRWWNLLARVRSKFEHKSSKLVS
jgi:hypothetical protein